MNGQLRLLHRSHFRYGEAEGYLLGGGLRHLDICGEGIGQEQAIEPGFHSERSADGQVTRSPAHRLPEGGQHGLAPRVGAAHRQLQLLMEDAQMILPIEEKLIHNRLRAGEAEPCNGLGLLLANPRRHPHAVLELRPVPGNRRVRLSNETGSDLSAFYERRMRVASPLGENLTNCADVLENAAPMRLREESRALG